MAEDVVRLTERFGDTDILESENLQQAEGRSDLQRSIPVPDICALYQPS